MLHIYMMILFIFLNRKSNKLIKTQNLMMKKIICPIWLLSCFVFANAQKKENNRDRPFDAGWRFMKDSTIQAEAASFDDSKWRVVDLPHDWSIEDLPADQAALPNQIADGIAGPFDKSSIGK